MQSDITEVLSDTSDPLSDTSDRLDHLTLNRWLASLTAFGLVPKMTCPDAH